MDDVAFHRDVFELDRMTPASVGGLLWRLAGEGADRSSRRVRTWVRSLLGAMERGRNFHERGEAAVGFARDLRCPQPTLEMIPAVNEYWDGGGQPGCLAGDEIPVGARVVGVAQSVAIWAEEASLVDVAARLERQAGGRFDPEVVRCAVSELRRQGLEGGAWLDQLAVRCLPDPVAPVEVHLSATTVARVFARVVDSKSPFTARHSERVALLARAMAEAAGGPVDLVSLAALLHDLGKLAIPNTVLDKNGPLDDREWAMLLRHPADSRDILRTVGGWRRLADIAGAHHERPDGRGYDRGLAGGDIPRYGDWLAAADSFDAMVADRPYREGMSPERALAELRENAGTQFTVEAVALLEGVLADAGRVAGDRTDEEAA